MGSISTAEAVQYCEGIASVLRGDTISTVGDSISTVEAVQYSAVLNSLRNTEPTLYEVIKPSFGAYLETYVQSGFFKRGRSIKSFLTNGV